MLLRLTNRGSAWGGTRTGRSEHQLHDAVNIVSRLEGLTKNYPCKILFNEGVYESVGALTPCLELGVDHVSGREGGVRLFGISDDWIRQAGDNLWERYSQGMSLR